MKFTFAACFMSIVLSDWGLITIPDFEQGFCPCQFLIEVWETDNAYSGKPLFQKLFFDRRSHH
jgi:hypothetical protein